MAPAPARAAQGSVVAIGGALRDDNAAVWQRLVDLAGGPGARYVVLATASGSPEAAAAAIVANLQRHGAVAQALPVAPALPGVDLDAAVRDPRWTASVRAARGVFFSGGAQARLVDTLQPGGRPTPLLLAIRELLERGGVVAGTSSGAAVLSATMFRDAPDVLAALQQPLRDGIEVDRGFGLLPAPVVVDQHFVSRGRIGRLLPLMVSRGLRLGLGVEEDSAAVVQGSEVAVIGARGVVVVDLSHASAAAQPPLSVQDARLHWLQAGDRYDLATRQVRAAGSPLVVPATAPTATNATTATMATNATTATDAAAAASTTATQAGLLPLPADRAAFHADMLGTGVLVAAMTRLVDSADPVVLGLAFQPGREPGFEWRLSRSPETRAWDGGRGPSIADLRLDVRPVAMASPLYRALPGR